MRTRTERATFVTVLHSCGCCFSTDHTTVADAMQGETDLAAYWDRKVSLAASLVVVGRSSEDVSFLCPMHDPATY